MCSINIMRCSVFYICLKGFYYDKRFVARCCSTFFFSSLKTSGRMFIFHMIFQGFQKLIKGFIRFSQVFSGFLGVFGGFGGFL